MSYCRFGASDIYLFLNVSGYVECCGCILEDTPELVEAGEFASAKFATFTAALEHVQLHRAQGHFVPEEADKALIQDRVSFDDDPTRI